MNGDTCSVLTFLFYEITFIAYAYSHCAEADSEGVRFPPVFKYPIKWNHLASVRPNYFIFIGYLRYKRNKISKPILYIWTPFPEILDPSLLCLQHARTSICWHACSSVHAYLVGLDIFLSGLPSTLCALGQNNGSGVCASSECPDYCVFAHARLSCRCSHISWHACITNSSGEFEIPFEH